MIVMYLNADKNGHSVRILPITFPVNRLFLQDNLENVKVNYTEFPIRKRGSIIKGRGGL